MTAEMLVFVTADTEFLRRHKNTDTKVAAQARWRAVVVGIAEWT